MVSAKGSQEAPTESRPPMVTAPKPDTSHSRANRALDAVNFFLADVRDGLGPYLAIYLLTEQHWDEARIGIVMSIATVAGILAQTPAGALVDAVRIKRAMMIAAAVVVTAASVLLLRFPEFGLVAVSQGKRDLRAGNRGDLARRRRPSQP